MVWKTFLITLVKCTANMCMAFKDEDFPVCADFLLSKLSVAIVRAVVGELGRFWFCLFGFFNITNLTFPTVTSGYFSTIFSIFIFFLIIYYFLIGRNLSTNIEEDVCLRSLLPLHLKGNILNLENRIGILCKKCCLCTAVKIANLLL